MNESGIWGIRMKRDVIKKWSRFFIIFMTSIIICLMIGASMVNNKQKLEQVQMERLVLTKSNKLNEVLSKLLYKTQTLSVLVVQNEGDIEDFEGVAAAIVDDPSIKNILIAPNGVVSHVYPLEGNEEVIGFDYFAEGAGNKEAVLAKENGQLILGGPFELVQGGQALVGRLPVYLEDGKHHNRFWGIVSVTLNYPQALNGAELATLEDMGFAYELWRISPDTGERQVIAASSAGYSAEARYVERPVTIFNAEWYFRIAPIREWYQYVEAWISIFLGLFLSLLLGFLYLNNYDLKRMRKELQNLSEKDTLTGVLNRRGLFQIMERLMNDWEDGFSLSYLDLNKFKGINDNYGHNAGDRILQSFTYVLQKHAQETDIIARIGGDEFILIFRDKERAAQYFEKVRAALQEPVILGRSKSIQISFSLGQANYPEDGITIDELIAKADEAMYDAKRKSVEEPLT